MGPESSLEGSLGRASPGFGGAARIEKIILRRIDLPLTVPYRLSYRTFTSFEPIVVEIHGSDGSVAWGDGHISPGSSDETRAGGWAFCQRMAPRILGRRAADAIGVVAARLAVSKVAGSALISALEMLSQTPLLIVPRDIRLPLLAPVNGLEEQEIATEIAQKLAEGFRTFKIKVGKDVGADLARVASIQSAVGGRATLRIDANRAYDADQGCRFAVALDPTGIELFEQPCAAEDWAANARVAACSMVPLMLDEPIGDLTDIERAASIEGVGFCKLKLKRFGGLAGLKRGLERVLELGLEPVLGDGLGSEISAWMEACVAQTLIRNAGEFNGFLKPGQRLFEVPLGFEEGDLVLPKGFTPRLDRERLNESTLEVAEFAAE